MNLKEAFRYQNKLLRMMGEAQAFLDRERNLVRIESTMLRHKVNPDAPDETTLEVTESEYAGQATNMAVFLMFLLNERERLSQAICATKRAMEMDFDGEVSLNAKRQELAATFRRMSELRGSEMLYPGQGVGYKFNAEGNQVSYRCDLKKVTTIDFDRNKVRAFAAALSKKADQVSAELDRCMVNAQVDYVPPFDVNETFGGVFRWHAGLDS